MTDETAVLMDKYEKAIREKVYAANILTEGEWVYLVGLFHMANDHAECDGPPEIERLKAALWPFAMKGLHGTTVCEDDFRRAKEAMPHAPDHAKMID